MIYPEKKALFYLKTKCDQDSANNIIKLFYNDVINQQQ